MQKKHLQIGVMVFLLAILVIPVHIFATESSDTFFVPIMPEPELSVDGNSLINAPTIGVVEADPNLDLDPIRIPAPVSLPNTSTAISTFQIIYQTAGQTDPWGQTCYAVPDSVKAPLNYAGVIWGNLVQSSVPITIQFCWGSLTGSTLGYSGGGVIHKDFTNAPRAATWFSSSLANSLAGTDLYSSKYDMYITYNKNFTWYTGTDANPPAGTYDLVTVALHEICHGLNFAGSMIYSSGAASWGFGTGYPSIYDTFMRDGSGNSIINTSLYANGSTALGTAVTSNNLWFHGLQAMSANGGTRVKMYAPTTWSSGSSYSHLDYNTFSTGNNRLMRYAISSGTAIHDPGPITMGLLKDVGWRTGPGSTGGVTGKLHISSATGAALSGATVTCGDKSATTGTDGSYTITGIATGSQTLSFSKTGYQPFSRAVTITAGQTLNAGNNFLVPNPTGVTGKLHIGSATGAALSGATVTCGGKSATTGSDGSYTITGIATGSQTLSFSKTGYQPFSRAVTITAGQTLNAGDNFLTQTPGGVTGKLHISSATGAALSGAAVTCGDKSATTGTDGSYTITGITPGAQTLSFSKTGYQPFSRAVTITAGQTLNAGNNFLVQNTSNGFDEQFNGSSSKWIQDSGTWRVENSQWYYTEGRDNLSNTATYNQNFTNIDYSAKLFRYGDDNFSNRLIIRGSGSVGSDGYLSNAYLFQYIRSGYFSVFKSVGGVFTALKAWTFSSAITQSSNWNTLRVVAVGSSFSFYINGTLVWSGADSSLTSGRVGVGMHSPPISTGNYFYVDWATLNVPSGFQTIGDIGDPDTSGKEESMDGDVNGIFR